MQTDPLNIVDSIRALRSDLGEIQDTLSGPIRTKDGVAPHVRFKRLLDISREMNSTLELNTLLDLAVTTLVEMFGAERGFLIVVDQSGARTFQVAVDSDQQQIADAASEVSKSLVDEVLQSQQPVLVENAMEDDRFKDRESVRALELHSAMCVPLAGRFRVFGAIYIDHRLATARFTEGDLELLGLFANQAAIAIENTRLYQKLNEAFYTTSMVLAEAIEQRDKYTGEHVMRVVHYSLLCGSALGLPQADMELLRLCAILHDVGKIGVPDQILSKPGRLTDEEFDRIKAHPAIGATIISHMGGDLSEVIPAVRGHHERVDGRGYPDGLDGDAIPRYARIIAVADTFDAMTSDRPYRKGLPVQTALDEIAANLGKQFDNAIGKAFLDAAEDRDDLMEPAADVKADEIGALSRLVSEALPAQIFWLARI